jgi:hypothetical protein
MNAGKPRLLRIGLRGGRRSTNRVGHAVYNVVPEPGLVPVPLPQPSIEKQSLGDRHHERQLRPTKRACI